MSTSAFEQRLAVERQVGAVQRRLFFRRILQQSWLWLIILIGLILMVIPGIWMVLASFKTRSEITAIPMQLLPDKLMFENYSTAIEYTKFYDVFMNSLIITLSITIANIFTCTWGGYTFGKLRWPGRDTVFMLILSTMMIPGFLTLIPRYILVAKMGMINSYAGMIVPFLTGAFGIFMTKQFMTGIPDELIDAATVDGSSAIGIYWRIILPLCKPIIAVLALFVFDWAWDDLLWGIMILTDRARWTLPIAIVNLQVRTSNQYELQMAGATLAVIPVVCLFLICQRYIVQGVTLSGLKG